MLLNFNLIDERLNIFIVCQYQIFHRYCRYGQTIQDVTPFVDIINKTFTIVQSISINWSTCWSRCQPHPYTYVWKRIYVDTNFLYRHYLARPCFEDYFPKIPSSHPWYFANYSIQFNINNEKIIQKFLISCKKIYLTKTYNANTTSQFFTNSTGAILTNCGISYREQ